MVSSTNKASSRSGTSSKSLIGTKKRLRVSNKELDERVSKLEEKDAKIIQEILEINEDLLHAGVPSKSVLENVSNVSNDFDSNKSLKDNYPIIKEKINRKYPNLKVELGIFDNKIIITPNNRSEFNAKELKFIKEIDRFFREDRLHNLQLTNKTQLDEVNRILNENNSSDGFFPYTSRSGKTYGFYRDKDGKVFLIGIRNSDDVPISDQFSGKDAKEIAIKELNLQSDDFTVDFNYD